MLSGGAAEAFGDGLRYGALLGSQINESGQILTYVELAGPGVNNENKNALILIDGDDVLPVVREGQRSPFGAPAGTMYRIHDATLANDATIFFSSQIKILNPRQEPDGLWKFDHGALTRLIAENDFVGDTTHRLGSRPGIAQVSTDNGVVVDGWLDRPTGRFYNGLIGERDGIVQVFQPSDPLPGLPNGVTFVGGAGQAGISPSGALAFAAALEGPSVTAENELAMFAERGGSLDFVVRKGDAAVEAGPGVKFDMFTSVAFNERRSLAFFSRLSGAGVTPANEEAIWFENGTTPKMLARKGALAPGFSNQNVRFTGLGMPAVSGEDKVVFYSRLEFNSQTEEGVFSWDEAAGLQKLVSSLEPAPGIDDEAYFRILGLPVVNGPGQVAFKGEACTDTNCFYGLWAQDSNDKFRLVIGEGQAFRVGPGDWRVVDGFEFSASGSYDWASGDESGDPIVLLDDGTLVFNAYFEDGSSGVFSIDTLAVPEPSTAVLATIAATITLISRRRLIARTVTSE